MAARSTRVTVLSAAAAATAALSGGAAQFAVADQPGALDHAAQADRLDRLYEQAEQATQRYDAAQERTEKLRGELTALQDRAARGQQRVNRLRDELGALAASQYRDGALDPSLELLLSEDPADYLDRAATLSRIGDQQAGQLRQLQAAEQTLEQQRHQAAAKLGQLRRAGALLQQRKKAVQRSLAAARRILTTPPAGPGRDDYRPGSDQRASRGRPPTELTDLPASSGRAALAVAAVRGAVGAPYVWGATGPNAFDCSGLMLYAYRQAGVALPRTSQEQLDSGTHVPLDQVRPGDLVIYRSDASHVGMYVGGGQVVHAPYPGARVRYDPVGMMPITAVTRPAG
nr:C40 family peptidase [Streptomyces sp. SID4948]